MIANLSSRFILFVMCLCLTKVIEVSITYHKMSEGAKHLPTDVESQITGFDSSKLKHAECQEKTCLPSANGISLHCIFAVVLNWPEDGEM